MKKILILMSLFLCGNLSMQSSAQAAIAELSNEDVWVNLIEPDSIENLELEAYVNAYPKQFCTPVAGYSNMITMAFDRRYENSGTVIASALPYASYARFLCSLGVCFLSPVARKVNGIARRVKPAVVRVGRVGMHVARGVCQRACRCLPAVMLVMT